MNTLLQDIRYALRMLAKSPGFTAIAVLTLALGIGANTAIFTVVYAALLRPLPYSHAERLLTIAESRSKDSAGGDEATRYWNPASYPDFQDWTRQSKSFAALAGYGGDGFLYNGEGEPQLLDGAQASTNFFSTLGVKPILGRDFAAGEDVASGPKVALLTYSFWRTQFGGSPKAVGQTIRLDGNAVTIIGVLPRTFEFAPAGDAAVWVPLHLSQDLATRRNLGWFRVLGRLAPGQSLGQANAEMAAIMKRLAAAYPQEDGDKRTTLIPLRERIVGDVQPLLWILFGAVGLVLLIACANVVNLLLVRAAGRRREFAIRAALGAGRGRLIAQLLTESLMLAGGGGVLGFLGAQWGTPLVIAAIPQHLRDRMPFLSDAHASGVVFAFLCAAAVLTGVLFGLAPALQISHAKVSDALKEETQTVAGGLRAHLRDALVIAEIAVCLVLLVGAGLMVKSLGALLRRNPGFSAQNLLTFGVYLPLQAYPKDPDQVRFDQEFSNRLKTLPGVVDVAAGRALPLSGGSGSIRFVIEGHSVVAGHEDECDINDATPDYFTALKIPLLQGRFFDDATDKLGAPGHLIVNQAFVDRYLPGENPIGKRLRFTYSPKNPFQDIVGVVGSVPDNLDGEMSPVIYTALRHNPDNFITYGVRTTQNPAAIVGEVRNALREMNAQLPLYQPETMEQVMARSPSVFLRRYPSYLIGCFAALALILACVGLYGLISYSVAQRTREMGIRMALGAQQRDLLRMVMGQGVRLAIAGVAIGVAAALALTRLMSSLLYGVKTWDPVTFMGVAIVLVGVALAACYLPARRAMNVDPMVALRHE